LLLEEVKINGSKLWMVGDRKHDNDSILLFDYYILEEAKIDGK